MKLHTCGSYFTWSCPSKWISNINNLHKGILFLHVFWYPLSSNDMQCTLKTFESFPFLSSFHISSSFSLLALYFLSSELNSLCSFVFFFFLYMLIFFDIYLREHIHQVLLFFSSKGIAFLHHKQSLCLPLVWQKGFLISSGHEADILIYGSWYKKVK